MAHTRRDLLVLTALAITTAGCPAIAASEPADALIRDFAGDAAPEAAGLIIDMAVTVESGFFVSIAIEAASAMQGEDFVEAIRLIAPGNPRRVVATFEFGELAGRAHVATRMRLAQSQEVIALARMKDGRVRIARHSVIVSVGGCQ